MKIKIEKQTIENILNQIVSFTDKRDNTQITSHILIEVKENQIIIKATDKETGIEIKLNANIIKEGTITINGKKFLEIIKTLKNKEIEIEEDNYQIIIKQEESIYKLLSFNPEQFPNFPNKDNCKEIEIEIEEFEKMIKKVYPVIDSNNPKYELNGALFDLKENSNFVSTDTKRLAIYKTKAKAEKNQIIVHKKSLAEIKKILQNDMKIFYNNIYLIIENENVKFFTKLINGKFPEYEKILPNNFKYIVKLPKSEFLNHIKRVNIISNNIKIKIKNDTIEIESLSDDNLKALTKMNIKTEIENFIFAVNSKYIIDFLNSIDKDQFYLCLNEPEIPFVLKEDEKFSTIIMPLTI